MRYSFHGKVRATGQWVDGHVEAPNSAMAIDRLADQGIIGVQTVRADPEPPKHVVRFEGEPPPPEVPAPVLEAPTPRKKVVALPAPQPAAPPAAPAVKAEPSGTEVVFTNLVDKLGSLLVQVERLMSRPTQQVIYQTAPHHGPVRESSIRVRRTSPNQAASNTLRDIFQTNLDLRNSLEKLANSTGTSNRVSEAASQISDAAEKLTEAAIQTNGAEAGETPLEPNGTPVAFDSAPAQPADIPAEQVDQSSNRPVADIKENHQLAPAAGPELVSAEPSV